MAHPRAREESVGLGSRHGVEGGPRQCGRDEREHNLGPGDSRDILVYPKANGKRGKQLHLGCVCMLSHFSHALLFSTPWTVARQAPLSRGFPRQECWSGLPCPPPGDPPDTGTEPVSHVPCVSYPPCLLSPVPRVPRVSYPPCLVSPVSLMPRASCPLNQQVGSAPAESPEEKERE